MVVMKMDTSKTVWEPLKQAVGESRCQNFMFIGIVTAGKLNLYLYKHRNTRRYLNLDCHGSAYKFAKGKYGPEPVKLSGALNHVYS